MIPDYCHIEPADMYKVLMLDCGDGDGGGVTKQSNESKQCDMVLYPSYIASPYSWANAKDLFKHNSSIDIASVFKSYIIHYFSSHTANQQVNINENSLYEFYGQIFCPIVYSHAKESNSPLKTLDKNLF